MLFEKNELSAKESSYLCSMSKIRIALFASGNGSNALRIAAHFNGHQTIEVAFILSNNPQAKVIETAKQQGIQTLCVSNQQIEEGTELLSLCKQHQIDYVVLAGFLRKIPASLIQQFPERIFNIHPSLLPKFGGEGMYGMHVHRAVVANQERETGITIHWVDEEYDRGAILVQARCAITEEDSAEQVQQKVQSLEHAYFSLVIEQTILIQQRHVSVF